MTERWMKEKASKSFGGSCMSKFVLENERKRILRLKNMKSSIKKMSCNRHENDWMKNNIEKRCREIKQSKKCLNGDGGSSKAKGDIAAGSGSDNASDGKKQFDLVFHRNVDVTKSGLKLRLTKHERVNNEDRAKTGTITSRMRNVMHTHGIDKNEQHTTSKVSNDDVLDDTSNNCKSGLMDSHDSCKNSLDETKSSMKNRRKLRINEGKENQSPSKALSRTKGLSLIKSESKTPSSIDLKKGISKDEKINNNNNNNNKLNETKPFAKTLLNRTTTRNIKQSKHPIAATNQKAPTRTSISVSKASKTMKSIPSQIHQEKKKKFQHLHANRGVSLTSLSKEKEQALAMLKELDIREPLSSSLSPLAKKKQDNKKLITSDEKLKERLQLGAIKKVTFVNQENQQNACNSCSEMEDNQHLKNSYQTSTSTLTRFVESKYVKDVNNIDEGNTYTSMIHKQPSSASETPSRRILSCGDCVASSPVTGSVDNREIESNYECEKASFGNDRKHFYSSCDGSKIKEEDSMNLIFNEVSEDDNKADETNGFKKINSRATSSYTSLVEEDGIDNQSDECCAISGQVSVDSSNQSTEYSDSFDSDKSDKQAYLDEVIIDEADAKDSLQGKKTMLAGKKKSQKLDEIDWTPQFKAESFFEQIN